MEFSSTGRCRTGTTQNVLHLYRMPAVTIMPCCNALMIEARGIQYWWCFRLYSLALLRYFRVAPGITTSGGTYSSTVFEILPCTVLQSVGFGIKKKGESNYSVRTRCMSARITVPGVLYSKFTILRDPYNNDPSPRPYSVTLHCFRGR